MTSSGVPLASTAWMDGIATVNPISAIMPSTVEPATAQITPRGTLRLGLTASSDMSAASSNPTSVNAPRRPARANEYSSGLPPGLVVFPRMLKPYGDGLLRREQREQHHAEHESPDDLGEHGDVVDPGGDLHADDVDDRRKDHQHDGHGQHQVSVLGWVNVELADQQG